MISTEQKAATVDFYSKECHMKQGTYHGNNNNKIIPVLLICELNGHAVASVVILDISKKRKVRIVVKKLIMNAKI